MTGDPRPHLPPSSVLVDAGELAALLDSGATRQEIRRWLAAQAQRQAAEHDGGGDDATPATTQVR